MYIGTKIKMLKKILKCFVKEKEFNPARIVTPSEIHFVFEVVETESSHILRGHGFCWLDERPFENDGLLCEMKSGKKVLYRLFDVDRCSDPNDMYFAKAEPIRYMDSEIKV